MIIVQLWFACGNTSIVSAPATTPLLDLAWLHNAQFAEILKYQA